MADGASILAPAIKLMPREPMHRRTGQPVRRDSREPGRHASGVVLAWDEVARRLAALGRLAGTAPREPGRRRGCPGTLSVWAEKVYEVILKLTARHAGQVYPSYAKIAQQARCSVRTVARCLRQLREGGWLEWTRRFEHTGQAGIRGPQVKQISNFYRVTLPAIARDLLASWADRREGRGGDAEAQGRALKRAFREQCEAVEQAEAREAKKREQEARSPALARAQAKAETEAAAKAASDAADDVNDSRADNPGPGFD